MRPLENKGLVIRRLLPRGQEPDGIANVSAEGEFPVAVAPTAVRPRRSAIIPNTWMSLLIHQQNSVVISATLTSPPAMTAQSPYRAEHLREFQISHLPHPRGAFDRKMRVMMISGRYLAPACVSSRTSTKSNTQRKIRTRFLAASRLK